MNFNVVLIMAVIFEGLMFIKTHGPQEILLFNMSDWDDTPAMKESVRRELSKNFWTDAEESHRGEKPLVDYKNWGLRVSYSGKHDVAYITNYGDSELQYLLRDGQAGRFLRYTIKPNQQHRIPFEAGHWLMTWIWNPPRS
ncbi:hypothetical protein PGT21_002632 [Puccinia graminis f. sp. tritici]|uniref:Uncharacterized protein n=1 Tax=Puccinia graminis f. sp. tritici TaxID=56615 RepID=A0A5B0NHZ8_PUCGR|nr:hypothetical protein PGT21_002632 [Puccinia graminis f. sp. tritici]